MINLNSLKNKKINTIKSVTKRKNKKKNNKNLNKMHNKNKQNHF